MRFFFKKSPIFKFTILGKKESDFESDSAILSDSHLRFRIALAQQFGEEIGETQIFFKIKPSCLPT